MVFSHRHNSLNKEALLENQESTKTTSSRYTVDDFITNPILKQFYMTDMNQLLENYEPGKPEYKPKMLEQMKQIEAERNKRLQEHNKMLEAQQIIMQRENNRDNKDKYSEKIEVIKSHYEKQLADKSYLINELLKKVKDLTLELAEYKK
jgi:hypothetical protein